MQITRSKRKAVVGLLVAITVVLLVVITGPMLRHPSETRPSPTLAVPTNVTGATTVISQTPAEEVIEATTAVPQIPAEDATGIKTAVPTAPAKDATKFRPDTGKRTGDSQRVIVPDVYNMTVETATSRMKKAGLVVGKIQKQNHEQIRKGYVCSTLPAPGKNVKRETAVDLTVSVGPVAPPPSRDNTVIIPNVAGLSQKQAQSKLEAVGLVGDIYSEKPWSDTVSVGYVIRTIPAPEEGKVRRGSTIQLVLSKGPQWKCPYCTRKFSNGEELTAHQTQSFYACSRYPDCTFMASTKEAVIQHYKEQSKQVVNERILEPNCRNDAMVIGTRDKWRMKVIPAPACLNSYKSETWKLEKVRE